MAKKHRSFADDGWAVWVDGEDTSTVYLNDWLNPKGKSYIDIAVRIRGIKTSQGLHVYAPFIVSKDEIEDVSLRFDDTKILQATFSVACIVDYKKNEHTSEVAYNGKTVDIPSYLVKEGDVIAVKESKKEKPFFVELKGAKIANLPKWVSFDTETLTGKVEAMPTREDVDLSIAEHMIVELYSK